MKIWKSQVKFVKNIIYIYNYYIKFFTYYTTHMKKLFSLFSMLMLLSSNALPAFTYANTEAEDLAKEILTNELMWNLEMWNNEVTTFWNEPKIATLYQWTTFQDILKDMANWRNMWYWDEDEKIAYFIRADSNKNMSWQRLVSSWEPVYVWFDDSDWTWIVYWYSEADKIYLNSNIEKMFAMLTSLKELDLSDFDSTNVDGTQWTKYTNVFYHANSLKKLNLNWWNFTNFHFENTNIMNMFNWMGKINELYISWAILPPHSQDFFNYMYQSELKFLDATNLDFSNATSLDSFMYASCAKLETIKWIETRDVSGITNMHSMFENCKKITNLDLSNFDTRLVTNMNSMFKNNESLQKIEVWENFSTANVTNSTDMFKGAENLVWEKWTPYNENKINKEYARIDAEWTPWYFSEKVYTIVYDTDWWTLNWEETTYKKSNKYILPIPTKTWNEFIWWYEIWTDNQYTYLWDDIKWDKELMAYWKSLEEKVEETTTENVVYTNTTTVTVWDEATEEVLSWSLTLSLKTKEVEDNEVKKEEDTTKVQESEIKVTSDKTVEFEWWLEVYLEKTENAETEKLTWTIKFSAPVAVKIPISSDTEYVKVQVKHWEEDFGFKWLTLNPVNECNSWEAVNDKYNWEDVLVTWSTQKYATIYTCSASTFVAYTENNKPVENITTSSAAAWGWRTIATKQETKITEQEHNSADTVEPEVTQTSNQSANTSVIKGQVKKIEWRALTRWEVAIMTNILLEVYPQLVEWKQELDDVTNACSNYADEQNFTKDEKKAITRLCKLSIMWIHNDTNEPLEEFLVNNKTTNDEFSKVINRSVETYNEKDLTTIKDALKKLEWDEENVVFGTVYDMFMGIKNIFSN